MLDPGARIELLTSGGDAPGMNAALRAAAKIGAALAARLLDGESEVAVWRRRIFDEIEPILAG